MGEARDRHGLPCGLTASEAAASEAGHIAINVSQYCKLPHAGRAKILSDTWNNSLETVRPCAPLASMVGVVVHGV